MFLCGAKRRTKFFAPSLPRPRAACFNGSMSDTEDEDLQEQPEEDQGKLPSGSDELMYALAQALRTKRSKEAIASLIQKYADQIPLMAEKRHRAMLWSYAFTLLVMLSVGILGYAKIITSETAGTLLGAVVGAIFYGRRSN